MMNKWGLNTKVISQYGRDIVYWDGLDRMGTEMQSKYMKKEDWKGKHDWMELTRVSKERKEKFKGKIWDDHGNKVWKYGEIK